MSLVYEDENKRVTVALCENDYVNVVTLDNKSKITIRNVNGKLIIEKSEVDEK